MPLISIILQFLGNKHDTQSLRKLSKIIQTRKSTRKYRLWDSKLGMLIYEMSFKQ